MLFAIQPSFFNNPVFEHDNIYMILAFVLVNCHFPFDKRIKDEISSMPFVSSIDRIEGRYDLIIKINAETEDKLRELISKDISTIRGVDGTLSLIIVS
jgi:DNA-binding Lrp family transcriptional regulator